MKQIKIRVIPSAKKSRVVEAGDILRVYLTAPPVDGKANKALIELLSEYFKVRKSCVKIVRGETSRNKVIEVIA